jgi:tetratricopeptide (TPR) repeat protein
MLTLVIAGAAALLTFLLIAFVFNAIAAILPSLVVLAVTYFLIARRLQKGMEKLALKAQAELQKGRIDAAIGVFETIKTRYGKWQLFTNSMIDGQIGGIYYMRQDFDKAKPYLEKAFIRHWVARAMLAVICFKKRDYKAMDKHFEKAAAYSPKQGLLWSLWAYCHYRLGHVDRAIAILLEGKKKLGDADSKLNANLLSLQNEKKMKMRGYGDQWYQFMLEIPPQMVQAQTRRVKFVNR